MRSGFYKWYQWFTNIVQGSTKGTIGKTIGNAKGTTDSPNGAIGTIGKPMMPLLSQWYHWLPMVKLPMLPLENGYD